MGSDRPKRFIFSGLGGGVTADYIEPISVSVLIQDPHKLVRECLRVVVEGLYGARVVAMASSPAEALEAAKTTVPHIAVIDLADPDEALPVAKALRSTLGTKVIAMAELPEQGLIEAAVRSGVTGIALKSDSVEDLLRAFDHLNRGGMTIAPNATGPLVRHYLEVIEEKRKRDGGIIETLASAIEAKDHYTGHHTHRVADLAAKIAAHIDPFIASNEQIRYGFILHDVGKIGIPEPILRKEAPLDEREWQVMKTHPIIGLQIISPLQLGDAVEEVVRYHHERWDGGGYPDGLAGEDIPVSARIFSVADAYDAMTTDRPYRRRMKKCSAVEEIKSGTGTQFDPSSVDGFLEVIGS